MTRITTRDQAERYLKEVAAGFETQRNDPSKIVNIPSEWFEAVTLLVLGSV